MLRRCNGNWLAWMLRRSGRHLPKFSHSDTCFFKFGKDVGIAAIAASNKENNVVDKQEGACLEKISSSADNVKKMYMVVFGGGSPSTGPMNDIHILDVTSPAQCRWVANMEGGATTRVQGSSPAAREMHSAVFIPSVPQTEVERDAICGNIYVFGGRGAESLHRDCAVLNIETMSWDESKSVTTAISRLGHVAIPMAPKHMAIVGGFDGAKVCQDLMILNLENKQWTEASLKPKPLVERFAHSVAFNSVDRQVYIFGGSNAKEECKDLVCIDLSGIEQDFDAEKANTDGDVVYA